MLSSRPSTPDSQAFQEFHGSYPRTCNGFGSSGAIAKARWSHYRSGDWFVQGQHRSEGASGIESNEGSRPGGDSETEACLEASEDSGEVGGRRGRTPH